MPWRGGTSQKRLKERAQIGGGDVVVANSNEMDPGGRQGARAVCVPDGLQRILVGRAIEFQREPECGAVEIRDEAADGVLAAKFQPQAPPAPQDLPRPALRRGGLFPERPRQVILQPCRLPLLHRVSVGERLSLATIAFPRTGAFPRCESPPDVPPLHVMERGTGGEEKTVTRPQVLPHFDNHPVPPNIPT